MYRLNVAPSYVLLSALLIALFGCDKSPTGDEDPDGTNFQGAWTLVSSLVQKAPCNSQELDETVVDAFTLSQSGHEVTLEFDGYSVAGMATESSFTAAGTLPGGDSIRLDFSKNGGELEGSIEIEGGSCSELRSAIAKPRVGDANFSGHWHFQLMVEGPGGCEFLTDYNDCFRILQTGRDLLVVDDEGGNLHGTVTGTVAEIERHTENEVTWLLFHLDEGTRTLTGDAFRRFLDAGCRTDLDFVGAVSSQPCRFVDP